MYYANYGMRRANETFCKHETASLTGKFVLLKLFYWKQFLIKRQHKISIFPFSFFRQSNQSGSFALIFMCQDENFHRTLPCRRFDILKFCMQAITEQVLSKVFEHTKPTAIRHCIKCDALKRYER